MKPFLKIFWGKWKKITTAIGNFNSRLLLTIFYFTLVIPFALVIKFSQNKSSIKSKESNWINNFSTIKTKEDLERQS